MTKEKTLEKLNWAITCLREMADELQATKVVVEKIKVDIECYFGSPLARLIKEDGKEA